MFGSCPPLCLSPGAGLTALSIVCVATCLNNRFGEQFRRCTMSSLDFGSVFVPNYVRQSVAGDQAKAGIALKGLLAGLHDHTRRFKLDQAVMGVGLIFWDVDDQFRRFEM